MILAGRGGFVMLFRSRHACLAFSLFGLLGELLFVQLERQVFGFLPACFSNGKVLVTPCDVIRSVFRILAPSEASLYGVLILSTLITPFVRFTVESFFLPPLLLYGHLPMQRVFNVGCLKRQLKIFGPKCLRLVAFQPSRYPVV